MSLTTKRNSKGLVTLQKVFYCICTVNTHQFIILKIEAPCSPNIYRTGSLSTSSFFVLSLSICLHTVWKLLQAGEIFQGSSTQASCRLSCWSFKCYCSLLLVLPLCWATAPEAEFAEINTAIILIQMPFSFFLQSSCRNTHIPLKTLVEGK